jgi:hypothetical protein
VTLSFDSLAAWWWPYLFILIAGVLATEVWRWIGVFAGGVLREGSTPLIWVKSVATALVAAVVGQLIVFPSGDLAGTPLLLRAGAAAAGWIIFRAAGNSVLFGVLAGEAVLLAGWLLTGF